MNVQINLEKEKIDILKAINDELDRIAIQLDKIPQKIQQAPELQNRENILLIGKALSHIFELQSNIHKHRSDLKESSYRSYTE